MVGPMVALRKNAKIAAGGPGREAAKDAGVQAGLLQRQGSIQSAQQLDELYMHAMWRDANDSDDERARKL